MGKIAMKIHLEHDKATDVAFVDVCEAPDGARIEVQDMTECLGLKCQVLARIDAESGDLLGLIIQDYGAFRREIRIKYVALAVDRIIDLFVITLKGVIAGNHSNQTHQAALC